MNLRDVEYFVAIVEERSFSRAAARLYVAQPSLSTFLSRLEKVMGVTLILRNNNTITLTRAGEIYYNAAKEILEIQKKMLNEIDTVKKSKLETISVGVSGERTIRLVSRVLTAFYQKYPNVHIALCENTTQNLTRFLQEDEIDFSIHPVHSPNPDFKHIPVRHEEIVVALPKQHRLAHLGRPLSSQLQRVNINEFREDSFVLLTKGTIFRQIVDAYFENIEFNPKTFTEVQSNHSNMMILSSGIEAVGFCPAECDYGLDNLLYVALERPFYYDMALCYRKGNVLTPAREYFVELIKQYGNTF